MDKTNLLNAKSSTTNNTNAMAEILTDTDLVLDVSSYQHRLRPYPRGTTSLVARETVYSGLRYWSTRTTYRYKLLFHHYPPNLPMVAREPTLCSHLTFCPLSEDGNGGERKRGDTETMEVEGEEVKEEEEDRLLSKHFATSSFLSS